MGKKSIKENKKIYQELREELGYSRKDACDLDEMAGIPEYRLTHIEDQGNPTPEEVFMMSCAYKKPELCSWFCANECRLGKETNKSEIRIKDLSNIVLGMLNRLNTMEQTKDRLISITADGDISEDELEEFCTIQDELVKMSDLIETMRVWTEKMIYDGKINKEKYEKIKEKHHNSQKK